jgi:aldose sugar dehydrogenase
MRNTPFAIIGTVLTMTVLSASGPAFAVDKVFNTEKTEVHVTTFADGLTEPWGLAALPDGGFLVTEKQGNLRYVTSGGKLSAPLKGVPKVDSRGQGGLLDVALDPEFQRNRLSAIPNRERAATRPPWRVAC